MYNEILISLIFGHILTDFILQSNKQVEDKKNLKVQLKHSLWHAIISCINLWTIRPFYFPILIFSSHLVIDNLKTLVLGEKDNIEKKIKHFSLIVFLADQLLHIIVILILSNALANSHFASAYWYFKYGEALYIFLLLLIGLILTTVVTSHVIPFILEPFKKRIKPFGEEREKENSEDRGLFYGGRIIGILERGLIFLFLLINQPSSIGFLITAKTIFRFGEIREAKNRDEVEYIIIGTLTSFFIATILSLLTFLFVSSYSQVFNIPIVQNFFP